MKRRSRFDDIRAGAGIFALIAVTGSCSSPRVSPLTGQVRAITVLAPPGGELDRPQVLVDGQVSTEGWYCSQRPAPQAFELMVADGIPRPIHAIGFVPGNIGPGGIGPIEIRIQMGHGVMAHGETFHANVVGRSEQVHVVVLPSPVTGDHVVLTFVSRSPYNTANCLAEVMVYDSEAAYAGHSDAIETAVLGPAPRSASRRGSRRGRSEVEAEPTATDAGIPIPADSMAGDAESAAVDRDSGAGGPTLDAAAAETAQQWRVCPCTFVYGRPMNPRDLKRGRPRLHVAPCRTTGVLCRPRRAELEVAPLEDDRNGR